MKHRLLLILTVLTLLMTAVCPVQAEERRTMTYTGGEVLRILPRDGGYDLLELAYVQTTMPYIVLDAPTSWEAVITGGAAPYACEVLIVWQSDLSMDEFYDPWEVIDWFNLPESGKFTYTFTQAGRYFLQFTITDAQGQVLIFQTRTYEAYATEDEDDPTTVAGKVNQIIASEITADMNEYKRARVLHDWLIYNANYDYTYTNYDASGVLLKGTGVCDSYGRAYLMLCTAAGLEALYVTGQAGEAGYPSTWSNHGWNLVKIDGQWYHVDCTWDDPGTGGYENHSYFLLTDEQISADHVWEKVNMGEMFVPDADEEFDHAASGSYGEDYDFAFSTIAEYNRKFDALVASGVRKDQTVGKYTGSEDYDAFFSTFCDWANEKVPELAAEGLINSAYMQYWGDQFSLCLGWLEPTEYIAILEEAVTVAVGETLPLTVSRYVSDSNAFTCKSSNAAVAKVSATYSADTGFTVTVTGVSEGTATITITSADGVKDTIAVTVPSGFDPDFALTMDADDAAIALDWNAIPGVTEYEVVHGLNGVETILATTVASEASLTTPAWITCQPGQQIWLVGRRVAAGEAVAEYISTKLDYAGIAHTEVIDPATSSLTQGSHCSVCGTVLITQLPITDPHTWIGGVMTRVPSGSTDGEMTYTCRVCGEHKTSAICCGKPGDATDDDAIDMLDVISILEWYCEGPAQLNLYNSDVNNDDLVDMLDIVTVLEYFCGWDVELN